MATRHTTAEQVEGALTEPLLAAGLDLEDVELTPAGRRRVLRVAVDKDGGVTLDELAEATKAVDRAIEATDVMGEQPYTLEVTSRGVDRPLTRPRHWRRNEDRLVRVVLADGDVVLGRIVEADDEGAAGGGVVLDVDGSRRRVGYDEVGKAQVQVELNRRTTVASDEDGDATDGVAETEGER